MEDGETHRRPMLPTHFSVLPFVEHGTQGKTKCKLDKHSQRAPGRPPKAEDRGEAQPSQHQSLAQGVPGRRCMPSQEAPHPAAPRGRLQKKPPAQAHPASVLPACSLWPCPPLTVERGPAHRNNRLALPPSSILSETALVSLSQPL